MRTMRRQLDQMAGWRRSASVLLCVLLVYGTVSCDRKSETEATPVRPVRTVTAAPTETTEIIELTGHIAAENEASLAFRIAGRLTDRLVNVGDHVETGQELARLDPQDELSALRSAQAAVAGAQARLTQAQATFERQRQLLATGHTPRATFDEATKALSTAQAELDDAEARATNQALRVSWTRLQADAPGTISVVGAQPGEVIQTGQMVVRIARENGRDAVFDVPPRLIREANYSNMTVRLADDPSIDAMGRVREVAAQADPATRTFEVKVGLTDQPAAMRLGSTVTGSIAIESEPIMTIPASALTSLNGQSAVWIVDPAKLTVSLRTIQTLRFTSDTVLLQHGIETGDIVVTAGVHALHPGQEVRLLRPNT